MAVTKALSIRLAATGGEKLRHEFGQLGREGQHAFDKITHATKPASAGLKTIDAGARALNTVLRQAAGLVGVYAGLQGIKNSFSFIVTTNKDFERLHASLKTVTGSVQDADKAFRMIEDFASSTPFNVEQITEAFIKLKALGLDPSAEALESYGNTASAMGKNLMQFTEAVADAITGEFERLKEFGVKARVQGEQVSFTFQGVTTTVGKNAQEIETYLRQIGSVQFAGAMQEQMSTLGGIFSNIQDNFSKLAREVGAGGLNDALRDVATGLKETTDSGRETARTLGETLGTIVRVTTDSLGFLVRNADLAVEALAALLVARTVGGAITFMNLSILGSSGAIAGFRLMAQVSVATAAKMVIVEGAAKLLTLTMMGLQRVMLLLGGPAGIVVLAGFALYEMAKGHDAAGKAASDHREELEEIQRALQNTTKDVEALNTASRNEALARWAEKLNVAQENIRQVTIQLKEGELGSLWDQLTHFSGELRTEIIQTRQAFRLGKLSIEEYEEALWNLAVKYPEFTDAAKEAKERVLALRASMLAKSKAQDQINSILSGNVEKTAHIVAQKVDPKPALTISSPVSPSLEVDKHTREIAERHEDAVRNITKAFHELQPAAEQARIEANKWREETLAGLDRTKAGYEEFRAQIESIYQDKLRAARETDLQNSKYWEDGLKRGFQSVLSEAQDMATQIETAIKNAFKSMENALVDFVMTGKLDFKSLVDSIVADLVRMQIKQTITQPLSSALGAINFGSLFGLAHTGGVIGSDTLSHRYVNPSVFSNAPKYHTGGIVGNEVPIIAKRGETVFTPGQMRLLNAGLHQKEPVKVEVNIKNTVSGAQAHVESSRLPGGGMQLNIIVEQIEGLLTRNIARGDGLAPTLERRYGLNPASGSYR